MKQFLFLVGAFATISQAVWAAPICASGSLASYVALSSGGCSIGIDTFSNFHVLSGITGATAIPLLAVQVTPSGGSLNPTLGFTTNVQTTGLAEAIFSYTLSGNSFTASTIMLSGDGNSTHIQNLCGNGVFGPDGVSNCTGTTFGPLVAISSGTDSTSLARPSVLTVSDDFTLDAGQSSTGSASGGTFADRFTATNASAVPEPGTLAISALGVALLFTLKLRSKETL